MKQGLRGVHAAVLVVAVASVVRGEITVTVMELDGTRVSGSWQAIDQPGRIALHTVDGRRVFETGELLSLRPQHLPEPADTRAWPLTLWVEGGSIVPAEMVAGGDGVVRVRTPLLDDWELPIERLSALRWSQHRGFDRPFEVYLAERGSQDQLLAIREDRVTPFEGSLETLGPQEGRFNFRGRSARFTPQQAWGVIMARPGDERPAPVSCVLAEDHRLAGRIAGGTHDGLLLSVDPATTVSVPLATLHEIRFFSDRVLYLSTRRPVDVEQRGSFDVPWPVRFDRNVTNRPLTLRGRVFGSGIGVHAWCALTFEVPAGYRRLAATIGVDDATCGLGEVQFVVLGGDGTELLRSQTLTGREAAADIVVDITGHERITLVAEPAGPLDVGGHADWAEVRLIR